MAEKTLLPALIAATLTFQVSLASGQFSQGAMAQGGASYSAATSMVGLTNCNTASDGTVDDAATINSCLLEAARNGTKAIKLSPGVARLGSELVYQAGVSIYGSGRRVTTLLWKPTDGSGGVVLNTTNKSISNAVFSDFGIVRDISVSALVNCIVGGSTHSNYNSALAVFRNLFFQGCNYAVGGNGAPDIGIFDSSFQDIWIDHSKHGLAPYGSQNTVVNPRITNSECGLTLGFLSGESMAGVQVLGGTLILNGYDICIPDALGIRPSSFWGTWFEQSKHGILQMNKPNTFVKGLNFSDCTMQSSSVLEPLLDFTNLDGYASIERCNIIKTKSRQSVSIVPPKLHHGFLRLRDLLQIDEAGKRTMIATDK